MDRDLQTPGPGQDPAPVMDRLARLPGMGPKLLERMIHHLGSPQALQRALEEGDVERLAEVPGVSARLALRLVHALHDAAPEAFFATAQAAAVFKEHQKRLLARACTTGGRNRLRLLVPHPSAEERERRFAWCAQALEEARTLDPDLARRHLRRIGPLPPPAPSYEADVLLLFDSQADLQEAREAGLHQWAPLGHVRQGDLFEQVREAGLVLHASRDPSDRPHALEQVDHVVTIEHTLDARRLAPWGTLERFRSARGMLEESATLSRLRGRDAPSERALALLHDHGSPMTPWKTGDVEARAQVLLEEELQHAEKELSNMTLTGSDLVKALKEDLPGPLAQVYEQAAQRANRRLEEETGLALEAYTDTVPPRVEPNAIAAVASEAQREAARNRLHREHALAKSLVRIEEDVVAELRDHEAFDARLAVGSLCIEYGMTRPQWGDGLLVAGLRPLHLDGHVERVDYRLGLDPHGQADAVRVALLTGANSGGKTTLLRGLCLVVSLAHAGLFVPAARAVVPPLQEVHLFSESRDRGAGGLESLLLDLFPLTREAGKRLVLADELESVTELEAASEIIATFLEGLARQGTHAVVATHLAPHILPSLAAEVRDLVRIDGIEADGLDDEGRLRVTRSPRLGHLARSTPELIVRRLAATGPEELAGGFRDLAERLKRRIGNADSS